MKTFFLRFLPSGKADWKAFAKLSIFSLASTLMLSINGFIDNFMVGHIYHVGDVVDGVTLDQHLTSQLNEASIGGLGSAGQWWFLTSSIVTFFTGSVGFFLAQYFAKGDSRMAQRAATTKNQIAFMFILPIFLLMAIMPQQMISVFTHKGVYHPSDGLVDPAHHAKILVNQADFKVGNYTHLYNKADIDSGAAISNGKVTVVTDSITTSYMDKLGGDYVRIAAISWLMWSFIVPQNQSLREVGKPQGGAMAVLGALITHVSLNVVFIEGTDLGVVGPAIALICSRVVNFTISTIYIKRHNLPISVFAYPFIWDREIYRKWISRWSYLAYGVAWTIAIVFRTYFWSMFFKADPATTNNEKAVDAIVVLGIAGAVQNIFLVAFDSLQPLFSKYVSGNMGKDKMKEAKEYADRIMGFGVILALCISCILVGVAFLVPHLTVLWDVNHETLLQVRNCVLVVALVYFSWVILNSVRTVMSSGSRPGTMALIDGTATWTQALWILGIGLIHKYTGAFDNFGYAYLAFFVSDIVKLPFFLVPFYKLEWTKNHTKHEEKVVKVKRA